MSFTLSGSAAVQIAAPDPNSVLNPGLQIFPFYAFNLERRFYALYEIEDAHNNPLGVYINGVHMGIDNDLFELAK